MIRDRVRILYLLFLCTNLTASSHSIADIEIAANSDLENLRHWLIANKLSLNVAKTEFMLIGSPQMKECFKLTS